MGLVDPQQGVTTQQFRLFVEYYLKKRYVFSTPGRLLAREIGKLVWLTFDDGYYTNHRVLPLLKEYKIPATFYISSNNIRDGKAFWWDVIYRKRRRVDNELLDSLKKLKAEQIEAKLLRLYGSKSLRPVSDLDRQFRPSELKLLAREKFVELGNHTADHAILTNYSVSEMASQIKACQDYLVLLTGRLPVSISYPNGNYNQQVISTTKACGLEVGITVDEGKNLTGMDKFRIKRFILWGKRDLLTQFRFFENDAYRFLYNLRRRIKI